jgi:hypothetical protein
MLLLLFLFFWVSSLFLFCPSSISSSIRNLLYSSYFLQHFFHFVILILLTCFSVLSSPFYS